MPFILALRHVVLPFAMPRVHDEGSAVETGGGTGHENEVQHDVGTKTQGTVFYRNAGCLSDQS